MDEDDLMPVDLWKALPSNPAAYAAKEAWMANLIKRMTAQADFIAAHLPMVVSIWLSAAPTIGSR